MQSAPLVLLCLVDTFSLPYHLHCALSNHAGAAEDIRKLPDALIDFSSSQASKHCTLAICTKAVLSLFYNDFCKGCIFLRPAQTMDEIIVSASGYLKGATHNGYRIFVLVPADHCVFYPWPHFLPVERRKSHSSSFSIFNCLFSYLYSANVFADLRPRVFGRAASFCQH